MQFRNPTNGYIENKSMPWLWTLLFGGFYFIATGLWAPLLIWLLLAAAFGFAIGQAAIVLVIVMNVIFAVLAPGLIRSAFLRKGWVEISENSAIGVPMPTRASNGGSAADLLAGSPETRKCPYCAEFIKAEAILCRFCGKNVPPIAPSTELAKATNDAMASISDEDLMETYGITFDGERYHYHQFRYEKLQDAIAYAKLQAK